MVRVTYIRFVGFCNCCTKHIMIYEFMNSASDYLVFGGKKNINPIGSKDKV